MGRGLLGTAEGRGQGQRRVGLWCCSHKGRGGEGRDYVRTGSPTNAVVLLPCAEFFLRGGVQGWGGAGAVGGTPPTRRP